jgi:hypothetical protein
LIQLQLLLLLTSRQKKRLHKRFSSRSPHANRSSKKLVLPQKKESASLSPFSEALGHFQGYQECFFLFVYAGNNYTFGVNLKACLVLRILGLLENKSTNQIERRLAELQLLSRFLGFLVFSPNWRGNELDSSKFKTIGISNGINQLESIGLPIAGLVEKAWIGGHAIITLPWVTELLKMAKWDSQTQTSKNFRQLLANLRQIQAATFSAGASSGGRFGPSMLVVNFFLETVFHNTPSLPSSLPRGLLSDADQMELDGLDFECIGFSTVTFVSSNPHVEDLSNLIDGLHRIHVEKAFNKSRKLRPSVISVGPTVGSSVAFKDEVYDSKPLLGEWKISEAPASNGLDSNPVNKVKTKLSEAFFHQHRNLKEICEFTIDRVLKKTSGTLLRDCITKTIEDKELAAVYTEQDIDVVQQKVFDLSLDILRRRLDEGVRKSLEILGPPNSHARVLTIAISLAVDKGMQTGETLLRALISTEMPFLVLLIKRKNSPTPEDQPLISGDNPVGAVDQIVRKLEIAWQQLSVPVHRRSVDEISQALVDAIYALKVFASSLQEKLPTESDLRTLFSFVLKLDRLSASSIEWAFALEEAQSKSVLFPFLEAATLLCEITNFVPKHHSISCTTSTHPHTPQNKEKNMHVPKQASTVLHSGLDSTSPFDREGKMSILYEALKRDKDNLEKRIDLGFLADLSRVVSEDRFESMT